MRLSGSVEYCRILEALGVQKIEGADFTPLEDVFLDGVEIDEADLPEQGCDICGGVEPDEPEPVDAWLINEFIEAINRGDIRTARCLVERVFPEHDSAVLADRALCRCAA